MNVVINRTIVCIQCGDLLPELRWLDPAHFFKLNLYVFVLLLYIWCDNDIRSQMYDLFDLPELIKDILSTMARCSVLIVVNN